MNILIVTSVSIADTTTFIHNQVKFLDPKKVLCDGYQPYKCDNRSIFSFPLNISFFRVPVKRILPFFYTKAYNKSLYRFLTTNKFDVVLCNFGPQGANIADACDKAGIPLVVHFHGYDAFVANIIQKYSTKYQNMFQKANYLIAVSADMKQQLISLGAPYHKIIIRPCGVDTSLFQNAHPQQNHKTLLFVGRFTAKKAPDLLLKAFHLALQSVPDAKLVMIGKGELQSLVENTIQELGIQNKVDLLGWQSSETIAKEMQKARAYVQHSVFAPNGDSEGSPVSIIEAAGSGLPVISTRHAGIKESVIEDATGFLVDEGDWQGMGVYMAELLNNPVLAEKMGQAGRVHILKHYDINQQMNDLRNVLDKAVTKKEAVC